MFGRLVRLVENGLELGAWVSFDGLGQYTTVEYGTGKNRCHIVDYDENGEPIRVQRIGSRKAFCG